MSEVGHLFDDLLDDFAEGLIESVVIQSGEGVVQSDILQFITVHVFTESLADVGQCDLLVFFVEVDFLVSFVDEHLVVDLLVDLLDHFDDVDEVLQSLPVHFTFDVHYKYQGPTVFKTIQFRWTQFIKVNCTCKV